MTSNQWNDDDGWMKEVEIDYVRDEDFEEAVDPLSIPVDCTKERWYKERNGNSRPFGSLELVVHKMASSTDDEEEEEEEIEYAREEGSKDDVGPLGNVRSGTGQDDTSNLHVSTDKMDHENINPNLIHNGRQSQPPKIVDAYASKEQLESANPHRRSGADLTKSQANFKKFTCKLCNYKGYDTLDFHRHCRAHHSDQAFTDAVTGLPLQARVPQTHECAICGLKFVTRDWLKRHMETHEAPSRNGNSKHPINKVEKPARKESGPRNKAKKPARKESGPSNKVEGPAKKESGPSNKVEKPARKGSGPSNKVEKPARKESGLRNKAKKPARKESGPSNKVEKPARKKSGPRNKVEKPARKESGPRNKAKKPARKESGPRNKVEKPARNKSGPSNKEGCNGTTLVKQQTLTVSPAIEKHLACKSGECQSESSTNVKRNEIYHDKARPYKCKECSYTCMKEVYLKVHERDHRDAKTDLVAGQTEQMGNLRSHLKYHTGESPNECSVCRIRHTLRSNLKAQKRLHTGNRPYCCDTCGKEFLETVSLGNHMKTCSSEPQGAPETQEYPTADAVHDILMNIRLLQQNRVE